MSMSGLSKCSFCPHGITDDQGSQCSVVDLIEDPRTKPLVRRTIEIDCRMAQRSWERFTLPEPMLIA